MIELHQVTKSFTTSQKVVPVLQGVDLTISAGQIVGIVGKSGAGKSTLLRCINLLERPTSGTVSVNGIDLMSLDARALRKVRRGMGMIFQGFNLLASRTVFDNVALPLEISQHARSAIADTVYPLLELTGLTDKALDYPARLSGGQKQRVAIARALVTQPKMLLCDEATSSLDPKTTASILDLLIDIRQKFGLTIVLVTHEMDVVKKACDHVAVLEHGQITRQSTPTDSIEEVLEHVL